jgi:hypothetical protein
MTDRHLLPDEIDQLLDSEAGLTDSQLAEHLAGCPTCTAEYESGLRCMEAIERLPHLEPSPLFNERVMAGVNIFQPWDVAAHDAVDHLVSLVVPKSPRLRLAAGGLGLSVALALSAACVWLAGHLDAVFFFGAMARARLRDGLLQLVSDVLTTVFGPQSVAALSAGGPVLLVAVLATVAVVTLGAGYVVRSAVMASRRSRL